ncbi:hypothetical protein BC832DRAFT_553869 [Gaertneriomyces semiglobifer]|nr:hypothetical protein BC832DRAFT_553869 [Gaertneriomyces semiglobifer]
MRLAPLVSFTSFLLPLALAQIPCRIDTSVDHFPDDAQIKVEFAKGFQVSYHGWYKVIEIGGKKVVGSLCGAQVDGVDGSLGTVAIPAGKIAIDNGSEGLIGFFERLNSLPAVSHILTPESTVTSECVQQRFASGDISNLLSGPQPDILFSNSANSSVPTLDVYGTMLSESNPLARGEYLKLLAAFTNTERSVNQLWNALHKNYECLQKGATAPKEGERVAWLRADSSNKVYESERYGSLNDDYVKAILTHAGAKPHSLPPASQHDALHELLMKTDYLIDTTPWQLGNQKVYVLSDLGRSFDISPNLFPFGMNRIHGRALRPDQRINDDGHDAFLQEVWAYPDYLLWDLRRVFDDAFRSSEVWWWFRSLNEGDTPKQIQCTNPNVTAFPHLQLADSDCVASKSPSSGGSHESRKTHASALSITFFSLVFLFGSIMGWIFWPELVSTWWMLRDRASGRAEQWKRGSRLWDEGVELK